MLLPIHRLSSSKTGLFSCLTKRPSFLLNKLIIRWIACACIAIAFIWFGGPRLADSLSLVLSAFKYPPPSSALAPHLERPLNPPPQPTKEEQDVWEPRKNEVRNAFKHAWSGYKSIAYPNDELMSLSGGTSNKLRSYFPFLSFN
jgi:mannosyl-oligosaccharide alpha-1,2-mannosidase